MEKEQLKALSALCGVFLTLAACAPAAQKEAAGVPVRARVKNGVISGLEKDGVAVFKGVPFAKPPVGDLRFAPPQDAEDWEGALECTEFRSSAAQRGDITGSEDCLYLNIWAPAAALHEGGNAEVLAEKLPVYVWVHGGAFAAGAGTLDGAEFAKDGVILVNINYRLNFFGFFASSETYRQYGTTGNWGLLDQLKALRWVRDNIASFGGDPEKVTIGGESAGAYSVSCLLLSPLAKGLFRSVIMESGSALALTRAGYYNHGNFERSIEICRIFADNFGAKDDAEGLAIMRSADTDTIEGFGTSELDSRMIFAFQFYPVFDGYVLPKDPWTALDNGDYNKVNLIFGYNSDEGSIFLKQADIPVVKMLATRLWGYENEKKVLEMFPPDGGGGALEAARKIVMYTQFAAGAKRFGDRLSAAGLPVYGYHFAYAPEMGRKDNLGAFHTAEIPFAFGLPMKENPRLGSEVHKRWVSFIKTGDPNFSGVSPRWESYDGEAKKMLRFDTEVSVETMYNARENDFVLGLMESAFRAEK